MMGLFWHNFVDGDDNARVRVRITPHVSVHVASEA